MGNSPYLHPREGSSSYPGGGSQGGWLPIESLSFPEPQNVNVSLQELARKSSWEKQEARVMAPGCPSSEVRDLEGGGREKFGKKTRNSLGAAHVSLGGLFCFLVAVVGGGDSGTH